MMCVKGMCYSRSVNQDNFNYASNAVAQFEHQRSYTIQLIKFIKSALGPVAPDCNDQNK